MNGDDPTMLTFIIVYLGVSSAPSLGKLSNCRADVDDRPEGCTDNRTIALQSYKTVEDFDLCAPYFMPNVSRKYYLAAAGRCVTYRENMIAYQRLRIIPNMLRNVSNISMRVTLLNHSISMPIGASPSALQKLASKNGELDTVRATYKAGTVMILSSYSSTLLEDVADAEPQALKWMQMYMFSDRNYTLNLVRRAELKGYKGIVLTVDAPVQNTIESRGSIFTDNPANATYVNLLVHNGKAPDPNNLALNFRDITWLKRHTKLPIVVKGILNPEDAVKAVRSGASAIMVSNHGGRSLDYVPATIDVLEGIVDALKRRCPWAEAYVDGGVRNGFDVFKALARGARAAFIGRPLAWGLAAGEERGVTKVFDILRGEFNQTMILAGTPTLRHIQRRMVTEDGRYIIGKN